MTDDKIITMGGQPLPTPDADQAKRVASEGEIEYKRKILQRSCEIVFGSLERNALDLEKAAIVGNHTIQRRHELMDTARCIRVTMTWMMGDSRPVADPIAEEQAPQGINLPDKQDKPFFPPDQDGNVPNVKLPESPTIISP